MNRIVSAFLDRLTERFTAIIASVISSRVEALQAATQAEQQSQLEELARQYETSGMPEVAATLRKRIQRLTSNDLAAEAIDVMNKVSCDVPKLLTQVQEPTENTSPPDPLGTRRKPRRSRGDDRVSSETGPDVGSLEFPG